MQEYTDTIRKYASDDTRTGILENADGTGEVGLSDKEVGSRLAVRFTLNRVDQNVGTIRYQIFGCSFTIAACAAAAEIAEGLPLEEVNAIDAWAISNKLNGLPEERSYCAKLASQALQAAITSAQNGAKPVSTELLQGQDEDHTPRINRHDSFLSCPAEGLCAAGNSLRGSANVCRVADARNPGEQNICGDSRPENI